MRSHHTKTKGDLGVLKAQADLCKKGYLMCIPLSEHAPFDLITYKKKEFKRVQVKARALKNGKLDIRFDSSYSNRNGVHTTKIDFREIDLYCVYCLDTDECYYFEASRFKHRRTLSLRVKNPKNNQQRNIRWASDYEEVP